MNILDKISYKIIFAMKMLKYTIVYGKSFSHGKNFSFRKRFNVNVNNSGKLVIGNHVFFNNDCSINCKDEIIIGNNCILGENVRIYDQNSIIGAGCVISGDIPSGVIVISNRELHYKQRSRNGGNL